MSDRTSVAVEVRFAASDADPGAIEGTAVTWGRIDSYRTTFAATAFSSAAGQRVPMLYAHSQEIIGSWTDIAFTDQGLTVRGRLNLDVQRAREVRSLVLAGDLSALSVGFSTVKDEMRAGGVRHITEAVLHEVSIVPVGSVPGAKVHHVRADTAANEESTMPTDENTEAPNGADVAALTATVDELRTRLDDVEVRAARPATRTETTTTDSDERRAFVAYLARGDRADEVRTLRVSSDPQGGFLVPDEISSEMIRNLVEFSPIRSLASVRTTGAPNVQYPRRTGVTAAQWTAELQESTASEPAFGMVDVSVHELTTHVDISNALLADSAGMAETEVRLALAEDFGKKEGAAFISGTGVGQPMGMLVDASVAYTFSGAASTLGAAPADLLIEAMYKLPAAYRNRGTWVMNGNTLAAIRKLKDGTSGNYLWQPSYVAGQPETILGRPVVEAVDMPDIGTGAEPIIFGDFEQAYRIVDRVALSVLVNPYLLATKGVTRIHATRRVGAAVIRPAAIRKIRCATS